MKSFIVLALVIGMGFLATRAAHATSPCFPPSFAADFSQEFFPPEGDCPPDPEIDCLDLCEDWARFCKGWAEAAKVCFDKSCGKLVNLSKSECNLILDEEARKACKDSAESFKKECADFLKDDLKEAKDDCKGGFLDACVSSCIGGCD